MNQVERKKEKLRRILRTGSVLLERESWGKEFAKFSHGHMDMMDSR